MNLYPTLADLCGLPIPDHVEGVSLRPLLADPAAAWGRPALTTHGMNNHAIRTRQWRYIRYADGGEELYDELRDPYEWDNLANMAEFEPIKKRLSGYLPLKNEPTPAAAVRRGQAPSAGRARGF
jgi:arylsulfatase A-like enzyme